jgi:hypothetical protein
MVLRDFNSTIYLFPLYDPKEMERFKQILCFFINGVGTALTERSSVVNEAPRPMFTDIRHVPAGHYFFQNAPPEPNLGYFYREILSQQLSFRKGLIQCHDTFLRRIGFFIWPAIQKLRDINASFDGGHPFLPFAFYRRRKSFDVF